MSAKLVELARCCKVSILNYFLAKVGFGTADNELSKVRKCQPRYLCGTQSAPNGRHRAAGLPSLLRAVDPHRRGRLPCAHARAAGQRHSREGNDSKAGLATRTDEGASTMSSIVSVTAVYSRDRALMMEDRFLVP